MNIQVNSRNMPFLECFTSETRVKIIELLNEQPLNIKQLAEQLGLSSAIVTKHVQKLEKHGIVRTESISGTRGRQKLCHLSLDSVSLQIRTADEPERNRYSVAIPIGQYADYQVKPTCGLATETGIIGLVDDPRFFSDPEHVKAKHLWFGCGYVEYRIPNYLVGKQILQMLNITLEVCSEAPGYNEVWPSDLSFSINGVCLGTWTCPGDFGAKRGFHTPAWWESGSQHGLLKSISVRPDGSYLDGLRLSEINSADLNIGYGDEIRLQIACPETAVHCGGVSLFGRNFGNYDQDIEVTIDYSL